MSSKISNAKKAPKVAVAAKHWCSGCERNRADKFFYHYSDGRHAYVCKDCRREREAARRAA